MNSKIKIKNIGYQILYSILINYSKYTILIIVLKKTKIPFGEYVLYNFQIG